ncbi:receptor-interacting serine/threonine-protein kinase 3-like [Mixophyes fleayi]|uniref:receptor-interacting serine/threonine-protein kinase 3-like n=1 Tax=Mixophyes fleayi TaxID=3061075 RepID=UPI003F4DADD4
MQTLEDGDLSELKVVGYGGFGIVYKGWSKTLGMEIALKTVSGNTHADFEDVMKERDMMSKANYTYVLRLLGTYEKQEISRCEYGLVMEYMPHGSLRSLFHNIDAVPWALKFQIVHQVVLGMNYLHHVLKPPIIHRDLKTSNVLLNKSLDIQLTDFGLSKNETSVSSINSFAGTVAYMPPESFTSIHYKPTKQFDVYSFAILTWSVLSGQEPYPDADDRRIQLLVPNNSRPAMSLVEMWNSEKMVLHAIQLMQECWDSDPGNRPSFSAIINRTLEMQEAYRDEIYSAVMDVLGKLQNLSSLSAKGTDTHDGRIGRQPIIDTPDTSSFNITVFREILAQAERVKPEDHGRFVVPEYSNQEVIDARGFLRANLSKIVQAKPDFSGILDHLFSNGKITGEALDTLQSGTAQEQIRKTLRLIINNGQASCHEFLQLMRHRHSSLMRSLGD